ncbi:anti-sigma factor family protein [Plantactinospora sp. GCM10030261]|uniref:anti-sigma factor family protein n=1 Tax=Plantactinospora sp. GCM10030261 TaxID=3273420 RepID=UPI0036071E88
MTRAHEPYLLGAYVVGILDDAERHEVDDHLAGCEPCRREVTELRETREALDGLPPEALSDATPDADLVLARTLRQIRSESTSAVRRRQTLVAAAASVVVALAVGAGLALGRGTGSDSPPTAVGPSASPTVPTPEPTGVRAGTVVDPDTNTRLTASVTPFVGWVRVNASVASIPAGEDCRLVVVSRTGARENAAGWVVSKAGEADGVNLDGSVAVAPADVVALEVRNTSGRVFVTLPL